MAGMTKDDWINANTNRYLDEEERALQGRYRTNKDIMAHGGDSLDTPTGGGFDFDAYRRDLASSQMTPAEKEQAEAFINHYREMSEDEWDWRNHFILRVRAKLVPKNR
jgi:hypothetical protein